MLANLGVQAGLLERAMVQQCVEFIYGFALSPLAVGWLGEGQLQRLALEH